MSSAAVRFARDLLGGEAPVGIALWAREVLRPSSAPHEMHALADESGRIVGTVRAVRRRPALGRGAPTVYLDRTGASPDPASGGSRWTWRGVALGLALLAVIGRPAASQAPAAGPHLRAFDEAWTLVYERHFDTTFNGVDWVALRDSLRPRAAAAETREEVRRVIRDLLSRLGQSHFALIPEEAVEEEARDERETVDDTTTGPGERPDRPTDEVGETGLDVRLIGDDVVVTFVEPGTPGAEVGIRPGWIVRSIGGRGVDSLIERVRAREGVGPPAFRIRRAVLGRLSGEPESPVTLTLVDELGVDHTLTLTRRTQPSQPVRFGNLPTFFSRADGRRVAGVEGDDVVVVWFNFWMVPLIRTVDSTLFASRDVDGVVIDLRGNPGGVGAMVIGVAGHFFEERTLLGTFVTRDSRLEIRANPRRVTPTGERVPLFDGPVAILVDETSASASEVFAGGMQAVGRARVFGSTTAGAVLPAVAERLSNGDVLYHAFAEFVTADGTVLEGRGVVPDEVVRPTREDLVAGRDVVLDAALRWIHEERARH